MSSSRELAELIRKQGARSAVAALNGIVADTIDTNGVSTPPALRDLEKALRSVLVSDAALTALSKQLGAL
jgi:hypothetical protein